MPIMELDQVVGVDPAVVAEVLGDPRGFLAAAASASPGWAEKYGGAEGVVQLASLLQDLLARQEREVREVRVAAVRYLRHERRRTMNEIAALTGISAQAISRISGSRRDLRRNVEEAETDDGDQAEKYGHLRRVELWE